jgi:hypothetical protein
MEAISVKKQFLASLVGVTALSMLVAGVFAPRVAADDDDFFLFIPDTLVLSRSVYAGNASTVTVGQTLPPGCVAGSVPVPLLAGGSASVKVACGAAVADGTYPSVFNNDGPDGSFGITSPIFLDDITTDGHLIGTLPIPSSQIVTSFSSKSELALNLSTDGRSITFGGYRGGPGFVTGPTNWTCRTPIRPAWSIRRTQSCRSITARSAKWMRSVICKSQKGPRTAATTAARRSRPTSSTT